MSALSHERECGGGEMEMASAASRIQGDPYTMSDSGSYAADPHSAGGREAAAVPRHVEGASGLTCLRMLEEGAKALGVNRALEACVVESRSNGGVCAVRVLAGLVLGEVKAAIAQHGPR